MQKSIDVAKGQQKLIRGDRKVEKSTKFLKALSQPAYLTWKSACHVYLQKDGDQKLVDLIDKNVQKHCAKVVCELDVPEFLLLKNDELLEI